jgi:acetyl esterase/lipase
MVNTALSPFAAASNTSALEPLPAMWALLAFARREFDQTVNSASPAVNLPTGAISTGLVTNTQPASDQAVNPVISVVSSLVSGLAGFFVGVSPQPSTPGTSVTYSGSPSLLATLELTALDLALPFEKLTGIDFSILAPVIASAGPPSLLTLGLTVGQTKYEGVPVYELASPDPSGKYVVAIHGGAWVLQPTVLNWLSYTSMVRDTNATVIVPIYPLATQGGTASVVVPEMANLISSEIATHGASSVSVTGDSAGGGIALSAMQLLVDEDKPVPASMVLESPGLDASFSNPDIASVNDPVLNLAEVLPDALLWAGDLPLTSPLVSPLYGSLQGLPPTYVYSGSDEILAPDTLLLQQKAIAEGAPISFILRNGEIHDWALAPVLDGSQVQQQIYQELGLTETSAQV